MSALLHPYRAPARRLSAAGATVDPLAGAARLACQLVQGWALLRVATGSVRAFDGEGLVALVVFVSLLASIGRRLA
jgi:hypothetical protein